MWVARVGSLWYSRKDRGIRWESGVGEWYQCAPDSARCMRDASVLIFKLMMMVAGCASSGDWR
jgi:hypothetical protein